MAINKTLVEGKLSQLRELIRRIEEMDFTGNDFLEDVDIQDLIVFRLMQSAEIAIDIAAHLVASLKLPRKETAKEVFLFLGQKKILSKKVSEAMSKAAGFRNLAAHEYMGMEFDIIQVYKDYKSDIRDLKHFMAEIVELLERKDTKIRSGS